MALKQKMMIPNNIKYNPIGNLCLSINKENAEEYKFSQLMKIMLMK